MRHLYTLLLTALAIAGQSQITFTNQSALLTNPTGGFHSGVAVAVADMNGDGLDDIIRLNEGSMLSVEYQGAPNMPFANYTHGAVPNDAWAMVIGDVNNDGWNDILAGGAYDGVKVLANAGGSSFTTAYLTDGEQTFVQGSNFADINNDGWLDVFTCHDDGESRIWGNDGAGTFILRDEWIDMTTTPASDNSGNYGSVWTDFDNDRDLDLYIAKCRQGVDDPTDPRRINALFVNDGQNNYTEQAGKYGLKIGWQSWTADFQDIDNDGDMDCLVTNHDYPLQLLLNDGVGHFTDITQAAGVAMSGIFLQGIMRDFDNDGFVDIITVGNFNTGGVATHLFHNNGNNTFTQIANPFGSPSLGSLAVGDLNGDGFQDIYAAYQSSFNNPSNTADRLWMNSTANGNNYIAFDLHGIESNRMAVGARVEIHGSWGIQIREVRAGESYGIQNSLTQYYGIGTATEVDYAVVHWPSGKVDVVKNPTINQKNTITEGGTCTLPGFSLNQTGTIILCPGESSDLQAPAGADYLWSNGLVSQVINVSSPGNYSVVVVDDQGCVAMSDVLEVLVNPDETPSLSLDGSDAVCKGNPVVLTSSEAAGYTWSNGATTQSITVTQTGDYSVTIPGTCGDFTSQTIHIDVYPAPAPTTSNVNIPQPGPATLEATGVNLSWYDDINATVPVGSGPSFVTPVLNATTTFYVEDAHAYGGGISATGMTEHQGTNFFNGGNFNGQTIFETYQPVVLKEVTVGADQAGVRIIELLNEAGAVLLSKSVNVPVGLSTAVLDFEIPSPGNYLLTTNTANNQALFGTNSPRLYRSNEGVAYPYTVDDVISITGSDLGAGFYYYFYDWQVEALPLVCTSERVPVVVTVGISGAEDAQQFGYIHAQPNPSAGQFSLDLKATQSGDATISISDLAGRVVFLENIDVVANVATRQNIDLVGILPAGMYFLKITSGERSGSIKIVVE